jgi:hypothetical protein
MHGLGRRFVNVSALRNVILVRETDAGRLRRLESYVYSVRRDVRLS